MQSMFNTLEYDLTNSMLVKLLLIRITDTVFSHLLYNISIPHVKILDSGWSRAMDESS